MLPGWDASALPDPAQAPVIPRPVPTYCSLPPQLLGPCAHTCYILPTLFLLQGPRLSPKLWGSFYHSHSGLTSGCNTSHMCVLMSADVWPRSHLPNPLHIPRPAVCVTTSFTKLPNTPLLDSSPPTPEAASPRAFALSLHLHLEESDAGCVALQILAAAVPSPSGGSQLSSGSDLVFSSPVSHGHPSLPSSQSISMPRWHPAKGSSLQGLRPT